MDIRAEEFQPTLVKLVRNDKHGLNERRCGDCVICCTLFGVKELNKPMGVKCEHVCSTGCGIHPNWPIECREFECLWRSGVVGAEDQHPNKLGIMLTTWTDIQLGLFFCVHEVIEGALQRSDVNILLNELASSMFLYVFSCDGDNCKTIMGPRHKQQYAKNFFTKRDFNPKEIVVS